MKLVIGVISVFAMSLSAAAIHGRESAGTPRQQYSAILKDHGPVSGGLRDAETDLERKAAVERMAAFSSNFVKLAANHAKDPLALAALRQAVQIVVSTDSAALQTWEMNTSDFTPFACCARRVAIYCGPSEDAACYVSPT